MKTYLFAALILMAVFAKADYKPSANDLFTHLKQLEGVWGKEGASNTKFNISFELTANDSVLIETWNYEGKKHSLTLYHLNGNSVMATHYCPQGNQPRLELDGNSTKTHISFEYLDATNLESLENSHQHALKFVISDSKDKVLRKETYLSNKGKRCLSWFWLGNRIIRFAGSPGLYP